MSSPAKLGVLDGNMTRRYDRMASLYDIYDASRVDERFHSRRPLTYRAGSPAASTADVTIEVLSAWPHEISSRPNGSHGTLSSTTCPMMSWSWWWEGATGGSQSYCAIARLGPQGIQRQPLQAEPLPTS
jgi:hypothetical protein